MYGDSAVVDGARRGGVDFLDAAASRGFERIRRFLVRPGAFDRRERSLSGLPHLRGARHRLLERRDVRRRRERRAEPAQTLRLAANRRETLAPRKRRVPQLLQRGDAVAGGARAQLGNERRDVPGDGPGDRLRRGDGLRRVPERSGDFQKAAVRRGGLPFRALRQKPLDVVQGVARGRVDLHAGLLRSPHHRVVARLCVRLGVRLEAQARAPPPLERGGDHLLRVAVHAPELGALRLQGLVQVAQRLKKEPHAVRADALGDMNHGSSTNTGITALASSHARCSAGLSCTLSPSGTKVPSASTSEGRFRVTRERGGRGDGG